MQLRFNSDLEDEIEILQDEIENHQVEIEIQFGPGGRNHFEPGSKSLRTWVETTSSLEVEIEPQFGPGG